MDAETTTASAMEKKATATKEETSEPKASSAEGTGVGGDTKESSDPVTEATEEAETQSSLTSKIIEVAAPVTAAAAAAGAAVVGFISSGSTTEDGAKLGRETSPIPGTFPDTPVVEKPDLIDQVKATDDEPVPGAVVPSTTEKVGEYAETKPFGTGVEATAAGGFAAALAADAKANTAPTHIPSSSQMESAPDTTKGDSFNILPVPSATAPEGTKPLAETTYAKPTDLGSLAPEPVKEKTLPTTTESEATAFEPVTGDTNIISSATDKTEQLKAAALVSSEHAAHTAAKALSPDLPTPPTLNADSTLSGLTPGAGVTAIGTATDNESEDTGLSRLVATKSPGGEHVNVQADAKSAHVEPAIVLDDTKMGKPNVETLGKTGDAAVASTPVTVSVPTDDGVQEVHALGTAIVTEGGKESTTLKQELLENGKTQLPEGALAHLNQQPPATPEKPTTTTTAGEKGPATPAKDTPTKTPVNQSSASASKDSSKRVSGVPSEAETTDSGKKKKKGGFFRKLKKAFS